MCCQRGSLAVMARPKLPADRRRTVLIGASHKTLVDPGAQAS
jgi:hypothetical protein